MSIPRLYAAAAIVALAGISAEGQNVEDLFLPVSAKAAAAQAPAVDPLALRSRPVELNPRTLPRPDMPLPNVLRLNFFDDAVIDTVIEDVVIR